MPRYEISGNQLKIYFDGKPSAEIRNSMKAIGIWWNPGEKCWGREATPERVEYAKKLCGETASAVTAAKAPITKRYIRKESPKDYALKVKIKDIVSADKAQFEAWEKLLKDYVNDVMGEDNSFHSGNSVSKSQESVWMNCFNFIRVNLSELNLKMQEFELFFEYSLPGTVHERPDVLLLTGNKAISLEFKKKDAPQVDDNKDDVAQAIRYKEWLENHHKVTRDRRLKVISYLVCTHKNAVTGELRGIKIITAENFSEVLADELTGESLCSFEDEWLASSKTEMPDMLEAIEIMYREGRIPYISDVNHKCLSKVLKYIYAARQKQKKILILINGVPGAGKTAVGQSIIYEENKNGQANAVYLSGNGPLIEVLQYQINQVGKNKHMGENDIQGMKDFKSGYFSSSMRQNTKINSRY